MEITEVEKQIIEAYRNGAIVTIQQFCVDTVEEAIEAVNKFSKVTHIWDLGNAVAFSSFKQINKIEITAYLDNKKATDGNQ